MLYANNWQCDMAGPVHSSMFGILEQQLTEYEEQIHTQIHPL
jgi:hypothetical protein